MPTDHRDELKKIRTFPSLVRYLRDEMGWPIQQESFEDVDDLFYDFTPEELGLDTGTAAKIESIKRLRPLSTGQPWGIYFVKFEPKRLPVVALRRILSRVALKKRASANRSDMPSWQANDLLFVSNYGDQEQRCITFAHFTQHDEKDDLPTLKVLGWDSSDTPLHLDDVADKLRSKLRWPDDPKNLMMWRDSWRSAFTLEHREVITTSKALAVRLAELARAIRDRIRTVLSIEAENGRVTKLMKAFQEALVHDLDEGGFADMYAQTIAYGLLSARITNPKANTADGFAAQLPVTNPFLKELMETFLHVGGRKGKVGRGEGIDFDELGVSEVVELLDDANMEAVVRDFGDKNPQEDPVIHFYELFLKEYDKKQKVNRGVFYTPRPVVSYIVRSVHELLQTEFGLVDGLADTATWGEMADRHIGLKIPEGVKPADRFVTVLDPATGTGTFLVEVIDVIHRTLVEKWKREGHGEKKILDLWNDYVAKHLLPRLHGYELLMAPYAIAHLKIGLKLHETGYRFESEERARIYLTNSLEPAHDFSGKFEFMIRALANEAEAVNVVKRQQRFTVVMGNPPYANYGRFNRIPFILDLLEDYKRGLNERKINLDDDFIKFIRFGENELMKSRVGCMGFITNSSYLDGVTHRQMRRHLLKTFHKMEIVNIHGSTQRGEQHPTGGSDENVFDIKQGVAIGIFLANPEQEEVRIICADLWGSRLKKYDCLSHGRAGIERWRQLNPEPEYFFLAPKVFSNVSDYEAGVSLTEVFAIFQNGIKTDRDDLFFADGPDRLAERMTMFFSDAGIRPPFRETYRVENSSSYNLLERRAATSFSSTSIRQCLYRPFDARWLYYQIGLTSRPAFDVMRHMLLGGNIALLTCRQQAEVGFRHAFVTTLISECCSVSLRTREITSVFPLYLNTEDDSLRFGASRPNFSRGFTEKLHEAFSAQHRLTPEEIFHYIYAVLHSPGYRRRYAEFLKIDFPRLPLTSRLDLFRLLAGLGGELVALHLMQSPKLDKHFTRFVGSQNPEVEKVSWSRDTVWLNKVQTTGFVGVPPDVWDFHIGGYQVCEKWLKDRKCRRLSKEDILHYQKILVALSETIRLMAEIDEVIEKHGGWPDAFRAKSGKESAAPLEKDVPLPKVAESQAAYSKKHKRSGGKA